MGRSAFVGTLFLMAAAAVVVGVGEGSLGWLLGGGALAAVAVYARRQFSIERETGAAPPRLWFFLIAMAAMIACIYGLYWLATSA